MKVSRVLLAGVLLTIAIPVCAQSLGELAKKEAERRKATPAAKVYTNDDLKKITVPGDTVADSKDTKDAKDPKDGKDTADAKDAKAKDAKDAKDASDAKPAMGEAEWHARMNAAREDVRKGEMFRDALQSRINGLTADFTARDDPYQRAQIADERQKALAELDRVKLDIEKAKKSITDIEEDARKANVPAGWIR
jgi:SMC interacting uncharacterized protein involved in chromosome segregation